MTYFNNKDLCAELIISKAQGKLTEQAILIIKILCKRIVHSLKIPSNNDISDSYQYCLYDVFKYWQKFDVETNNDAFSYFSYLIKRSLTWGYPVKKILILIKPIRN